jgi:putative ABC transport system substrate-binding protein
VTFLAVELQPKMLELVRELVPGAKTIELLGNPNRPAFEELVNELLKPAHTMGLEVHVLKAGNAHEIDAALSTFARVPVDALLVLSDPVYVNRRDQLAERMQFYRIPTFYDSRYYVSAGGLAGYGASVEDAYRQAGI